MAKTDLLAITSPGSRALKITKYEKYCRLRASALPRTQAYREAGWNTRDDDSAYSHACRLEHRPGVRERIEYLSKQDVELIAEKRQRLERQLWGVLEADIGDCFETVDAADKDGNLATDETGKMLTVRKQRPKLLSELSPDLRKAIESVQIDARGNVVPQLYSKPQANAELRKMLNIGGQKEPGVSDISRLSDAELISQIAEQAKELGIEIDLNYRFAQPPKPEGVAGPPTDPASSSDYAGHSSGSGGQVVDNGNDTAVHDFPKFPPRADTSDADTGEAGSRPARKPALPTVFKDTRPPPERPRPTKPKPL